MADTQLNIPMLTTLAEWLEAGAPHEKSNGLRFEMASYLEKPLQKDPTGAECGTACCIAGAAYAFANGISDANVADKLAPSYGSTAWRFRADGPKIHNAAAEILGLTPHEADLLFTPGDHYLHEEEDDVGGSWETEVGYDDIKPEHAGKVVRHLIATGEVDWHIVFPDWIDPDDED